MGAKQWGCCAARGVLQEQRAALERWSPWQEWRSQVHYFISAVHLSVLSHCSYSAALWSSWLAAGDLREASPAGSTVMS